MAIKRASMLGERHIRNLRQKMVLRHRTEEASKKLEVRTSSLVSLVSTLRQSGFNTMRYKQ